MVQDNKVQNVTVADSNSSYPNPHETPVNKIANNLQDPNIVKILWTGGWDSTFRVLQLVIEKEVTVLPIYLIFPVRTSTDIEIRTINKIKKVTAELFPQTANRILPTFFFSVKDLPEYPDIIAKHKALKAQSFLGNQYIPLACLAKYFGLNNLELSIHVDDTAYKFIKNFVAKTEDQYGESYSLDPAMDDNNPLSLFKPFRLPILQWTKVAMKEHAVKTGTFEIMKLTWFCHVPKNGEPCGTCNPCKYTIEEGMEFRFPKKSLERYRKNLVYKRVEKKYPVAFKFFNKFSNLIAGKKTIRDVIRYMKKSLHK